MAKIVVGSSNLTQSLLFYPGLELAMLDNFMCRRVGRYLTSLMDV
jgi:hypothetical protein